MIMGASLVGLRTALRQWFGPLTFNQAKKPLQEIINRVRPDLIHAMRIPYEGMLSVLALDDLKRTRRNRQLPPLLVSVWGNDFTLHAPSTPLMSRYTRLTLRGADAIHTDCCRDLRKAKEWGYPSERPAIVIPGAGGVKLDIFSPVEGSISGIDVEHRIINPRGVRAYIRNDTFFQAAALVLETYPRVRFTCTGMEGDPKINQIVNELGISSQVDLLPRVSHNQMAELFREAQVAASISTHDGTPNTLLEAMACGCFPIAGDIESLREWIKPGVNGFLVDPADHKALSRAMITALNDRDLRSDAARFNARLVKKKALYNNVMKEAEKFYQALISNQL